MKRLIWLSAAIVILCVSNARAQEVPAWQFSGGYSYLDSNLNPSSNTGAHIHLNGLGASATENMNSWFGGRIEFNGYFGNETVPISGALTTRTVTAETITYGPVFSYRRYSRITPFVHIQLGAVHGGVYYQDISAGAYKFAMAPGAGLDFNLNRKTTIRVDGEYLMTRFLDQWQYNAVASVGIVLRFGHR